MFALHETMQRRVCRALFVVACVLPTVATVSWIGYTHRPWRESDWQRTLREQLHVAADVGAVTNPLPGVTRLQFIRFRDLRTNRPLGALHGLILQLSDSRLSIRAQYAEAPFFQLRPLVATIATWMGAGDEAPFEFRAKQATIVGPAQEALQLDDLLVRGDGRQWVLSAVPAGDQEDPSLRVRLSIERGANAAGLPLVGELNTQKSQLPGWLIADAIPGTRGCRHANFSGDVTVCHTGSSTAGRFVGVITDVDLKRALGDAPHQFQGVAKVAVHELRWCDGTIEIAKGSLWSGHGSISRSLLAEAAKRLYCVPSAELGRLEETKPEELEHFDEVACDFEFSTNGITLRGRCQSAEDKEAGCLIAARGRALLSEPEYSIPWLAQWVQVFSRPARSWLPATQEARDMSDVLPLPSSRKDMASRPIERR